MEFKNPSRDQNNRILLQALAGMRPGWAALQDIVLAKCERYPELRVEYVLAHPDLGIAILDILPTVLAPGDTPQRMRRHLEGAAGKALSRNALLAPPIVRIGLHHSKLSELQAALDQAFGQEPATPVRYGRAWVAALRSVLEATPLEPAPDTARARAPLAPPASEIDLVGDGRRDAPGCHRGQARMLAAFWAGVLSVAAGVVGALAYLGPPPGNPALPPVSPAVAADRALPEAAELRESRNPAEARLAAPQAAEQEHTASRAAVPPVGPAPGNARVPLAAEAFPAPAPEAPGEAPPMLGAGAPAQRDPAPSDAAAPEQETAATAMDAPAVYPSIESASEELTKSAHVVAPDTLGMPSRAEAPEGDAAPARRSGRLDDLSAKDNAESSRHDGAPPSSAGVAPRPRLAEPGSATAMANPSSVPKPAGSAAEEGTGASDALPGNKVRLPMPSPPTLVPPAPSHYAMQAIVPAPVIVPPSLWPPSAAPEAETPVALAPGHPAMPLAALDAPVGSAPAPVSRTPAAQRRAEGRPPGQAAEASPPTTNRCRTIIVAAQLGERVAMPDLALLRARCDARNDRPKNR